MSLPPIDTSLFTANVLIPSTSPVSPSLIGQKKPCSKSLSQMALQTALGIAEYIRNNWKRILVYLGAWAFIICCAGALNGFQATALPLALGLGIGFGAGMISGLITALAIDKKNKYTGKNTLWGLLTTAFYQLDVYGTRQILVAVAIAVLATAMGIIPQILGGFFGFCLGNEMTTVLVYTIKKRQYKILANPIDELNGSTTDPVFLFAFNSLIQTTNHLKNENIQLKQKLASMEETLKKIELHLQLPSDLLHTNTLLLLKKQPLHNNVITNNASSKTTPPSPSNTP